MVQIENKTATNIHCHASIQKFSGYKFTTQVRMGKYKSQQILSFIWNRTLKTLVVEHETFMFIINIQK
jgi:very-short-patch-repair endonuclease